MNSDEKERAPERAGEMTTLPLPPLRSASEALSSFIKTNAKAEQQQQRPGAMSSPLAFRRILDLSGSLLDFEFSSLFSIVKLPSYVREVVMVDCRIPEKCIAGVSQGFTRNPHLPSVNTRGLAMLTGTGKVSTKTDVAGYFEQLVSANFSRHCKMREMTANAKQIAKAREAHDLLVEAASQLLRGHQNYLMQLDFEQDNERSQLKAALAYLCKIERRTVARCRAEEQLVIDVRSLFHKHNEARLEIERECLRNFANVAWFYEEVKRNDIESEGYLALKILYSQKSASLDTYTNLEQLRIRRDASKREGFFRSQVQAYHRLAEEERDCFSNLRGEHFKKMTAMLTAIAQNEAELADAQRVAKNTAYEQFRRRILDLEVQRLDRAANRQQASANRLSVFENEMKERGDINDGEIKSFDLLKEMQNIIRDCTSERFRIDKLIKDACVAHCFLPKVKMTTTKTTLNPIVAYRDTGSWLPVDSDQSLCMILEPGHLWYNEIETIRDQLKYQTTNSRKNRFLRVKNLRAAWNQLLHVYNQLKMEMSYLQADEQEVLERTERERIEKERYEKALRKQKKLASSSSVTFRPGQGVEELSTSILFPQSNQPSQPSNPNELPRELRCWGTPATLDDCPEEQDRCPPILTKTIEQVVTERCQPCHYDIEVLVTIRPFLGSGSGSGKGVTNNNTSSSKSPQQQQRRSSCAPRRFSTAPSPSSSSKSSVLEYSQFDLQDVEESFALSFFHPRQQQEEEQAGGSGNNEEDGDNNALTTEGSIELVKELSEMIPEKRPLQLHKVFSKFKDLREANKEIRKVHLLTLYRRDPTRMTPVHFDPNFNSNNNNNNSDEKGASSSSKNNIKNNNANIDNNNNNNKDGGGVVMKTSLDRMRQEMKAPHAALHRIKITELENDVRKLDLREEKLSDETNRIKVMEEHSRKKDAFASERAELDEKKRELASDRQRVNSLMDEAKSKLAKELEIADNRAIDIMRAEFPFSYYNLEWHFNVSYAEGCSDEERILLQEEKKEREKHEKEEAAEEKKKKQSAETEQSAEKEGSASPSSPSPSPSPSNVSVTAAAAGGGGGGGDFSSSSSSPPPSPFSPTTTRKQDREAAALIHQLSYFILNQDETRSATFVMPVVLLTPTWFPNAYFRTFRQVGEGSKVLKLARHGWSVNPVWQVLAGEENAASERRNALLFGHSSAREPPPPTPQIIRSNSDVVHGTFVDKQYRGFRGFALVVTISNIENGDRITLDTGNNYWISAHGSLLRAGESAQSKDALAEVEFGCFSSLNERKEHKMVFSKTSDIYEMDIRNILNMLQFKNVNKRAQESIRVIEVTLVPPAKHTGMNAGPVFRFEIDLRAPDMLPTLISPNKMSNCRLPRPQNYGNWFNTTKWWDVDTIPQLLFQPGKKGKKQQLNSPWFNHVALEDLVDMCQQNAAHPCAILFSDLTLTCPDTCTFAGSQIKINLRTGRIADHLWLALPSQPILESPGSVFIKLKTQIIRENFIASCSSSPFSSINCNAASSVNNNNSRNNNEEIAAGKKDGDLAVSSDNDDDDDQDGGDFGVFAAAAADGLSLSQQSNSHNNNNKKGGGRRRRSSVLEIFDAAIAASLRGGRQLQKQEEEMNSKLRQLEEDELEIQKMKMRSGEKFEFASAFVVNDNKQCVEIAKISCSFFTIEELGLDQATTTTASAVASNAKSSSESLSASNNKQNKSRSSFSKNTTSASASAASGGKGEEEQQAELDEVAEWEKQQEIERKQREEVEANRDKIGVREIVFDIISPPPPPPTADSSSSSATAATAAAAASSSSSSSPFSSSASSNSTHHHQQQHASSLVTPSVLEKLISSARYSTLTPYQTQFGGRDVQLCVSWLNSSLATPSQINRRKKRSNILEAILRVNILHSLLRPPLQQSQSASSASSGMSSSAAKALSAKQKEANAPRVTETVVEVAKAVTTQVAPIEIPEQAEDEAIIETKTFPVGTYLRFDLTGNYEVGDTLRIDKPVPLPEPKAGDPNFSSGVPNLPDLSRWSVEDLPHDCGLMHIWLQEIPRGIWEPQLERRDLFAKHPLDKTSAMPYPDRPPCENPECVADFMRSRQLHVSAKGRIEHEPFWFSQWKKRCENRHDASGARMGETEADWPWQPFSAFNELYSAENAQALLKSYGSGIFNDASFTFSPTIAVSPTMTSFNAKPSFDNKNNNNNATPVMKLKGGLTAARASIPRAMISKPTVDFFHSGAFSRYFFENPDETYVYGIKRGVHTICKVYVCPRSVLFVTTSPRIDKRDLYAMSLMVSVGCSKPLPEFVRKLGQWSLYDGTSVSSYPVPIRVNPVPRPIPMSMKAAPRARFYRFASLPLQRMSEHLHDIVSLLQQFQQYHHQQQQQQQQFSNSNNSSSGTSSATAASSSSSSSSSEQKQSKEREEEDNNNEEEEMLSSTTQLLASSLTATVKTQARTIDLFLEKIRQIGSAAQPANRGIAERDVAMPDGPFRPFAVNELDVKAPDEWFTWNNGCFLSFDATYPSHEDIFGLLSVQAQVEFFREFLRSKNYDDDEDLPVPMLAVVPVVDRELVNYHHDIMSADLRAPGLKGSSDRQPNSTVLPFKEKCNIRIVDITGYQRACSDIEVVYKEKLVPVRDDELSSSDDDDSDNRSGTPSLVGSNSSFSKKPIMTKKEKQEKEEKEREQQQQQQEEEEEGPFVKSSLDFFLAAAKHARSEEFFEFQKNAILSSSSSNPTAVASNRNNRRKSLLQIQQLNRLQQQQEEGKSPIINSSSSSSKTQQQRQVQLQFKFEKQQKHQDSHVLDLFDFSHEEPLPEIDDENNDSTTTPTTTVPNLIFILSSSRVPREFSPALDFFITSSPAAVNNNISNEDGGEGEAGSSISPLGESPSIVISSTETTSAAPLLTAATATEEASSSGGSPTKKKKNSSPTSPKEKKGSGSLVAASSSSPSSSSPPVTFLLPSENSANNNNEDDEHEKTSPTAAASSSSSLTKKKSGSKRLAEDPFAQFSSSNNNLGGGSDDDDNDDDDSSGGSSSFDDDEERDSIFDSDDDYDDEDDFDAFRGAYGEDDEEDDLFGDTFMSQQDEGRNGEGEFVPKSALSLIRHVRDTMRPTSNLELILSCDEESSKPVEISVEREDDEEEENENAEEKEAADEKEVDEKQEEAEKMTSKKRVERRLLTSLPATHLLARCFVEQQLSRKITRHYPHLAFVRSVVIEEKERREMEEQEQEFLLLQQQQQQEQEENSKEQQGEEGEQQLQTEGSRSPSPSPTSPSGGQEKRNTVSFRIGAGEGNNDNNNQLQNSPGIIRNSLLTNNSSSSSKSFSNIKKTKSALLVMTDSDSDEERDNIWLQGAMEHASGVFGEFLSPVETIRFGSETNVLGGLDEEIGGFGATNNNNFGMSSAATGLLSNTIKQSKSFAFTAPPALTSLGGGGGGGRGRKHPKNNKSNVAGEASAVSGGGKEELPERKMKTIKVPREVLTPRYTAMDILASVAKEERNKKEDQELSTVQQQLTELTTGGGASAAAGASASSGAASRSGKSQRGAAAAAAGSMRSTKETEAEKERLRQVEKELQQRKLEMSGLDVFYSVVIGERIETHSVEIGTVQLGRARKRAGGVNFSFNLQDPETIRDRCRRKSRAFVPVNTCLLNLLASTLGWAPSTNSWIPNEAVVGTRQFKIGLSDRYVPGTSLTTTRLRVAPPAFSLTHFDWNPVSVAALSRLFSDLASGSACSPSSSSLLSGNNNNNNSNLPPSLAALFASSVAARSSSANSASATAAASSSTTTAMTITTQQQQQQQSLSNSANTWCFGFVPSCTIPASTGINASKNIFLLPATVFGSAECYPIDGCTCFALFLADESVADGVTFSISPVLAAASMYSPWSMKKHPKTGIVFSANVAGRANAARARIVYETSHGVIVQCDGVLPTPQWLAEMSKIVVVPPEMLAKSQNRQITFWCVFSTGLVANACRVILNEEGEKKK